MPKSTLAVRANIPLTESIFRTDTEKKEFHELIFADIGMNSDTDGITGQTTDTTLGMIISGVDFLFRKRTTKGRTGLFVVPRGGGLFLFVKTLVLFASLGEREVSYLGPSLQTQQHGVFCYYFFTYLFPLLPFFSDLPHHFTPFQFFVLTGRKEKNLTIIFLDCESFLLLKFYVAQEQEMQKRLMMHFFSPSHHSSWARS